MEDKIKAFIKGRPWLIIVLNIAYKLLGTAKAHEWFSKRFGVR